MHLFQLYCDELTSISKNKITLPSAAKITCSIECDERGYFGKVFIDGFEKGTYRKNPQYTYPIYFPNGFGGNYETGAKPINIGIKKYLDNNAQTVKNNNSSLTDIVDIPF